MYPWRRALLVSCVLVLGCLAVTVAPATATTPAQPDDSNVTVVAHYPTDDGDQNATLVTAADVAAVGAVEEQHGMYRVPVTLTADAGSSVASTLVEQGFTSEGVSSCRWQTTEDDTGYCLLTVVDGEVTFAASLAPELASAMESGDFEDDPQFVLAAQSKEKAQTIATQLRGGESTTSGSGDESATTTDVTSTADLPTTATSGDGGSGDADDGGAGEDAATSSSGSTPGFTVASVALALLSVALLTRR
ncbi:hypothetical protein [Haloarchaeobius sp. DT45]|uniref:hypothetical protein n=1 Tax=Haloarchaeobius sp. DT45 TaxID=3446116 RepID=UPI003F6BFD38